MFCAINRVKNYTIVSAIFFSAILSVRDEKKFYINLFSVMWSAHSKVRCDIYLMPHVGLSFVYIYIYTKFCEKKKCENLARTLKMI